ncbi:MAG: aspartyl protease family protein [Sphingomonadales bacterium]|nr:aspartyl protease family protein [Sphingomonadales bacterium]
MTDRSPYVIYYVMGVILVLSSLLAMRLPLGKAFKLALAWVGIFAGFFVLFAFRDEFQGFGQRLRAEALGSPVAEGGEVRIPIADDGHFWVQASVNGRSARFLIDSGASVTTVSRDTAQSSGVPMDGRRSVVETANGAAPIIQASADRLEVSTIARTDFPIDINESDETNVLGMNFLSSLNGWRVEGNYLILRP